MKRGLGSAYSQESFTAKPLTVCLMRDLGYHKFCLRSCGNKGLFRADLFKNAREVGDGRSGGYQA